ncbi:RNA polymerase sigma factor [Echinicola jeungdonensis]|uniref:RNA polymerase sigma factor n=1 Tax=Echinicola jeungdonensis TaxID=709343 RepID=A0ABV5J4L6_9BACT|nr:RNA polymerase sigma factor [Echinicola jeungdonensis]MDN3668735.1 RNA polymerase sigma factor [Echinicola jeungdonensis]
MKTFFEAYIWTLRGKLYRLAYHWLKDKEEAEDALQEAFEKAWDKRNELQKMKNPRGWMVRVLKNQSLQKLRERKRWTVFQANSEMSQEPDSISEDSSSAIELVFHFLKQLPEKQQEIFHLREVEGLTYEEIAEYLEISMDQIKVNLFRARKKLRVFLKEYKQDGGAIK